MNYRTKITLCSIAILILSLAACSSKAATAIPTATLLPPNPFEQSNSSSGGVGAYSVNPIGFNPMTDTFTYDGQPIEFTFEIVGLGTETELGFMFFLDGVLQPYQIVKTTQTENDPPAIEQEMTLSTHRMRANETVEFTVSFIPVTGKAGETLGLERIFLFKPSFIPESETQSFGIYQDGDLQEMPPVVMKRDAPQASSSTFVEVMTKPIPESEKQPTANNPTGRVEHPNFRLTEGKTSYPNVLHSSNGQVELTASIWGGVEADYRVTLLVNHQSVKINGQPDFMMRVPYDKVASYTFSIDTRGFARFNSLYAVILPVGESFQNAELWGTKTKSILLINDSEQGDNATSDPAAGVTPEVEKTPTQAEGALGLLPEGDLDLSSWLIENNVSGEIDRYNSGNYFHLFDDGKLLIATEESAAYLFDTQSGQLLSMENLISEEIDPTRFKIYYSKDVIGVFPEGPQDNTTSFFGRYNNLLEKVDSPVLAELFGFPQDHISNCALSQNGDKVACTIYTNDGNNQILIGDLRTKEKKIAFDFSRSEIGKDYPSVTSLAFAGNDSYLAFSARLSFADLFFSASTGFGVIDLEQGKLLNFTQWDALNEELIQVTDEGIYFSERHGVTDHSEGKIIRVDLETMQNQDIPFTNGTSWGRESFNINVSPHGQYFVGIEDKTLPGMDASVFTLRVYDVKTMQALREINIENGYPFVAVDEANRYVYVCYSVDGKLKLGRYTF